MKGAPARFTADVGHVDDSLSAPCHAHRVCAEMTHFERIAITLQFEARSFGRALPPVVPVTIDSFHPTASDLLEVGANPLLPQRATREIAADLVDRRMPASDECYAHSEREEGT